MLDRSNQNRRLKFMIGSFVVCFTGGITLAIFRLWELWTNLGPAARASSLIASIGALGTSILALATFTTIYQNHQNLEEQKRDREKPIALDVINQAIQPVLPRLWGDLEALCNNEEMDMDWYTPDGPSENTGNRPGSVFAYGFLQERDRTAERKLQQEFPELWKKMTEREQFVKDVLQIAEEIGEAVEPAIQRYIESKSIEDTMGNSPESRELVTALLLELDHYGESHENRELWQQHKHELERILYVEAGGKVEELRRKEEQLISMTEELLDSLTDAKLDLRERYGIASDEIRSIREIPQAV